MFLVCMFVLIAGRQPDASKREGRLESDLKARHDTCGVEMDGSASEKPSDSHGLERPINGEPPLHHHDLGLSPPLVGVDHHQDDDDDNFELSFSFGQQRGSESPGRWDVVPLTSGRDTSPCSVHAFVDVPFSKKTVWKGKIEQGTYGECKEVFAAWLSEALRVLQERGLAGDKLVRGANASHALSSYVPPGSAKLTPALTKPKRKLEVGSGQVQGHAKLLKKASIALPSQTFKEKQQKKIEQQPHLVPSSPLKSSQFLHQEFSPTGLISISQTKLLMVLSILAIILLIQLGTIIALAKSSKMHYIPVGLPQGVQYHGSHVRHCGRQDAITILEQHAHFLQEEIAIVEARLQTLHHNANLLKVHLDLVQRTLHKSTST